MGAGGSTASHRLHVRVTVPARSTVLLNMFIQDDPGEAMSIAEYFSSHLLHRIEPWRTAPGETQVKYELRRVLIHLMGETEGIEVTSLHDRCSDYLSMGLKKVAFELSLRRVTPFTNGSTSAQVGNDDDEDQEPDCNLPNSPSDSPSRDDEDVAAAFDSTPSAATTDAGGPRAKKQKSLGAFFGNVMRTQFGRDDSGKKVILSSSLRKLEENVDEKVYLPETIHCRFCKKCFTHAPALVQHEKACEVRGLRGISSSPMPMPELGGNRAPDATVELDASPHHRDDHQHQQHHSCCSASGADECCSGELCCFDLSS